MNKRISLLVAVMCLAGLSLQAQRIKGSDTVLPLTQKAAESYTKSNPKATTTVSGGGSGVGISALQSGSADIAQASRRVKFAERQKLQADGERLVEVTIAYDALALVIHPSNRVDRLTREQLEGIFTGRITNWKEVGGKDMPIVPYARETSSGTYEFFREIVLNKKNYKDGIMSMPATGAIIQSVNQTPGAIGYVGLAYLSDKTKTVAVSFDAGKTYTLPSLANARNKSYPIVRPLYYYYLSKAASTARPFVDYVLSAQGQRIVQEVGFIPIK
ncbi:MAG: PstS family phosphate ABC transporter substrate-binding protein [Porphyromonadaceae bacterium]|nr:PstS family phosphate ABC transporter substrate-binding protein [Porphyromonadaceae bacterium]